MKTNIFSRKNQTAMGLSLALLLGGFGIAQAQPSPVGTWDCALVSPWKGTAYLIFGSDFTINGVQIMTPPLTATNSYDIDRHTNSYGGAIIAGGEWHFQDSKVVGFYAAVSTEVQCTNYLVVTVNYLTNILDDGSSTVITTVLTNTIQNCVTNGTTNGVSFEATVKPGKNMRIKATVDGRPASLKGVPATALPDISGYYYGDGRINKSPFNEFFTLTLTDPSINGYDLNGQGPGYTFSGFALLSKKSVSFYATDSSSNTLLRAITGPINTAKGSAMLKGLQSKGEENGTDKITYKVTKQPNPPPPPPAE
jgi:hypothetical protein